MVEMIIAIVALIVAFGALWFAGEANKRAEFQQQQFHDSHIKPLRRTVTNVVSTSHEVTRRITDLEKMVDDLIETEEELKVGARLTELGAQLTDLRESVEHMGQGAGDTRDPQRRRLM